jgi:NADPH:quinone reductase-like Zn-dependent oxidoreductase
LPYASLSPIPTGKFSIIWGGSTSACCNAIELAVASSSEVNTTSSPRNFGLCKSLGASYTFDYNSKTVVPDMVGAFEGEEVRLNSVISTAQSAAKAIRDPADGGLLHLLECTIVDREKVARNREQVCVWQFHGVQRHQQSIVRAIPTRRNGETQVHRRPGAASYRSWLRTRPGGF